MTGTVLTKSKLLQQIQNLSRSNKLLSQQSFGCVVLLLAKAIGVASKKKHEEPRIVAEILKKQDKLSEIADMMYVSHLLHRDVLDLKHISKEQTNNADYKNAHMKNVVSVLVGDHFLAKSSRGLAELENPLIVELMAESLGDLSQGQFLASEPIISDDLQSLKDNLEKTSFLTGGSLLGNSCKSAALLAGFEVQDKVSQDSYSIGKHFGITLQLQEVLKSAPSTSTWFKPSKELLPCLDKLLKVHLDSCLSAVDQLERTEPYVKLRHHIVTTTASEAVS